MFEDAMSGVQRKMPRHWLLENLVFGVLLHNGKTLINLRLPECNSWFFTLEKLLCSQRTVFYYLRSQMTDMIRSWRAFLI